MPAALLALALLAAPPPEGVLAVTGLDYGAEVVVDRRPVGHIPLDPVAVAAGLHLIEVLRDGRPVWSRVVFVPPGGVVQVTVALPPRPGGGRTLGELRSGRVEPRAPPARYRLSGSAAVEGGAVGSRWDLDVAQRWRLDADGPAGISAAVEVQAVGDLAGGDPALLRAVHRASDAPIRVDEARLRWRGEALDARVGRLIEPGPGGRLFALDGGRLDGRWGALRVHARGGRRWALIGPQPEDAGVVGGGLALGDGALGGALDAVWHGRLHVDGAVFARGALGGLRLRGRTIGESPAEAALRLDAPTGPAWLDGLWVEGGWRGAARGPFEPLDWPLGVAALPSPAGARLDGALRVRLGDVRGVVGAGVFDGAGPASAARPDRWRLDAGLGFARRDWGVDGHLAALGADVGPDPTAVALGGRKSARFQAQMTLDRVRLVGSGGLEHLILRGPTGEVRRWLPVGGLAAAVALTGELEAFAEAEVSAAHPTLHPAGGPIAGGRIGVRLR